jgi:hypothetical protein
MVFYTILILPYLIDLWKPFSRGKFNNNHDADFTVLHIIPVKALAVRDKAPGFSSVYQGLKRRGQPRFEPFFAPENP